MNRRNMTEEETVAVCKALDIRCEINEPLDCATRVVVGEGGRIKADIRCILCNGSIVMNSLGYPTCSRCGMDVLLAVRNGVKCAFVHNGSGGLRTMDDRQVRETILLVGIAFGKIPKDEGHKLLIRWRQVEVKANEAH